MSKSIKPAAQHRESRKEKKEIPKKLVLNASPLKKEEEVKNWNWACHQAGIHGVVRKTDLDYPRVLEIYRSGGYVYKRPETPLSEEEQKKRDAWKAACMECGVEPWDAKKGTEAYELVKKKFIELVDPEEIKQKEEPVDSESEN